MPGFDLSNIGGMTAEQAAAIQSALPKQMSEEEEQRALLARQRQQQQAAPSQPASAPSPAPVRRKVVWNENMSFDELAVARDKMRANGEDTSAIQAVINRKAPKKEEPKGEPKGEPKKEEVAPEVALVEEPVQQPQAEVAPESPDLPTEGTGAGTSSAVLEGAQGMMAVVNASGDVQMIPQGAEIPNGYGPPDMSNPQIAQLVADAEAAHEESVKNPTGAANNQDDAIAAAEEITGKKMDSKQKSAFMKFLAELTGSEIEGLNDEQLAEYEKVHGKQTAGRRIGNIGDALLRAGMGMQGQNPGQSARDKRDERMANYQAAQLGSDSAHKQNVEILSLQQAFTSLESQKDRDAARANMEAGFEHASTESEKQRLFNDNQGFLNREFQAAMQKGDQAHAKEMLSLGNANAIAMLGLGNEFNKEMARLTKDLSVEEQVDLLNAYSAIGADPKAREQLANYYATARNGGSLTLERVKEGAEIANTAASAVRNTAAALKPWGS